MSQHLFILAGSLALIANGSLHGAPTPPQNLTAEAPVFGVINIQWEDPDPDEDSYILEVRISPQTDWSSLTSFNPNIKEAPLTGGSPATLYEFRIVSVKGNERSFSETVTVTMPDRFLNATYANISLGKHFEFTAKANNFSESQKITYHAFPLPNGLSIDSSSGIISGTATEDGYFDVLLQANYSSPEAPPALARLALRIPPTPKPPVLSSALPDTNLTTLGQPTIINLDSYFADPDTRVAVRIETNQGNMIFSLFDKAVTEPVENFLNYAERGDYSENVFHRSVKSANFNIIQSGSFVAKGNNLSNFSNDLPITNAPGIPNNRGTLAFARTSDPNSATSGWYINAQNNPGLDTGESYTVFGRATESSLEIIDSILSFPTGTHSLLLNGSLQTFPDFPTTNGRTPSEESPENLIMVSQIIRVPTLNFFITANTNPDSIQAFIVDAISGPQLAMTPLAIGTGELIVMATDIDGDVVTSSLSYTVTNSFLQWSQKNRLKENANQLTDRPGNGSLNNLQSYAFGGEPLNGSDDQERLPVAKLINIGGEKYEGLQFYHRQFISDLSYSVETSSDLSSWKTLWKTSYGESSPLITLNEEEEEFHRITIRNTALHDEHTEQFYRVSVHYLNPNAQR